MSDRHAEGATRDRGKEFRKDFRLDFRQGGDHIVVEGEKVPTTAEEIEKACIRAICGGEQDGDASLN